MNALLDDIPEAIWSQGPRGPSIYRGKPIDMVTQMAREMGPDVTPSEAIKARMKTLAKEGRLRLRISGDPPEDVLAGIFVYTLLQCRICQPMAKA